VKNLATTKYFIQKDEKTLHELFDCQDGFRTLSEAQDWIKQDDPKEEFAWAVYLVEVREVLSR
jgi:hypothetical protein